MRRLLATAVAVALLLVAAPAAPASADAGAEADFVGRINAARSGRGLGSLAVDGELTGIARRWSQKMANDQRLAHNPNLSSEVKQNWEKLAENVGFGGDVASIHEAFMNSSAHRANILDGGMTHVGVGVVVDGAGQIWVTEVFMRLRGGAAPPPTTAAPAPAPPPTAPPATSPPTTARPRPVTTTAPPAPPPPAPEPAPAPPEPEPAPVEAAPTPPPVPSLRLQLVLDRLVALDQGR